MTQKAKAPFLEEDGEVLEEDSKPVAAAERLISILNIFVGSRGPLSLAEISRRTGLYKSTILRLAKTLLDHEYLIRTDDGNFHVGPVVLQLSTSYQNSVQPQEIVVPILRELMERTGETASYVVPRDNFRICLYRVDSPHPLRDHGLPGDVAPLDKGAAGRIFLAFAHPNDPKYDEVRKKKIAVTRGELHEGMVGLAAPVFDADNNVIGVIGLTGPDSRFRQPAMATMEKHLRAAADLLTDRLGRRVKRSR